MSLIDARRKAKAICLLITELYHLESCWDSYYLLAEIFRIVHESRQVHYFGLVSKIKFCFQAKG
jgi:hypothetical protein